MTTVTTNVFIAITATVADIVLVAILILVSVSNWKRYGNPWQYLRRPDRKPCLAWGASAMMVGLLQFGIARTVFRLVHLDAPAPWWLTAADAFRVFTLFVMLGAFFLRDRFPSGDVK